MLHCSGGSREGSDHFGEWLAIMASPMRTIRAPRSSGPTLCRLTRAPSSTKWSSLASSSGSVRPTGFASPVSADSSLALRPFERFDHRTRRMLLLGKLYRGIRVSAASVPAANHVFGHVLDPSM